MPRRFPIVQFPNPPLIAAIVAAIIARRSEGARARHAAIASRLALALWSAEEIIAGANWFRRVLGAAGAAASLHDLLASTRGRSTQADAG